MRTSRTTPVPEGRTRWRRFGIAAGLTSALAGGLVYLAATGALAVSFAMSGIPFTLSASQMTGDDFIQYAMPDKVSHPDASGLISADSWQTAANQDTYVAATVTRLSSAKIYDLHQTVCAPIPDPLGAILPKKNLLVTILAGGGGNPATASNMVVDAPLMQAGSAEFTNINIGQDLGDALGGNLNGNFAQNADSVVIKDLRQVVIGTSAGTFKLTGLDVIATFVSSCPKPE